jgi:hypothetical protein
LTQGWENAAVADRPTDVLIAGVNKAGTTSLFVSLSEHPRVAPSAVKETRFFMPVRYGKAIPPPDVYDSYFTVAPGTRVRLEATPSHFYGGEPVARAIDEMLPGARIVVVLREPVARTISFFQYQKTRLRIPSDLPIEEYLAHADTLTDADFQDPANERYFAVEGSRYADFLPGWLQVFGSDRLRIIDFDDLTRDPGKVLRDAATWMGVDPLLLPVDALSSENRTMAYKSRRMQRVALSVNDRFERVFRRYPNVKRWMRGAYFKLNGQAPGNRIGDEVRVELAVRFRAPNQVLADQLRAAGFSLPAWVAAADARTAGRPWPRTSRTTPM